MVADIASLLGRGLYSLGEAAQIVRVTPQSLRRWVYGNAQGEAVFRSEYQDDGAGTLSFLDLMQALAVRAATRRDPKIPLPTIREAVLEAEQKHGVPYILARRHKLFALDKSLMIRIDDGRIAGLAGSDRSQEMMVPIIEPFVDEISFDSETGLANEWRPYSYENYAVVLNPALRFGQPLIQPGGYKVDEVLRTIRSEGSIEATAELFGIEDSAVRACLKYKDLFSREAA